MLPADERRKVLIAVDMSKWADLAFDWYVREVHQSDLNDVICFHSVEPPHHFSTGDSGALSKSKRACEEISKQIQEKFTEKMKENNVNGRVVVRFGSRPGESIVQLATSEHVTMIVMGTRGLGFIRRTILGSVSDYVLHHAHCPVAVCSHHGSHHGSHN